MSKLRRYVRLIVVIILVTILFGYWRAQNSAIVAAGNLVFDPADYSHLYWPFPNVPGMTWGTVDGSDHHHGADRYAADWNLPGEADYDKDFYAPFDGKVIYAGFNGDYGNTVVVKADNQPFAFRVAHLARIFVSTDSANNKNVVKGGVTSLGTIGSTGNSTGSHAHIALYKNIDTTAEEYLKNGNMYQTSSDPEDHAAKFDFNGPTPVIATTPYSIAEQQIFSPNAWKYRIDYTNPQIRQVFLDAQLILSGSQTCTTIWVGAGVHKLVISYQSNNTGIPTVNAKGFPYTDTDCSSNSLPAPLDVNNLKLLLPPNFSFSQTLNVQNTTTTTWNTTYKLAFQSGALMGSAPQYQLGGDVAPGQFTGIQVHFTTPPTGGNYRSYWRVLDGSGNPVSEIVWLEADVQSGAAPIGVGTGQVKLFTGTNYSGTATSYGTGPTNTPNATAFSLQMPGGWSVRTYKADNYSGQERCWTESVPNLQDYDNWQGSIQSMKVFNYNDCGGGQTVKLYRNTNYDNLAGAYQPGKTDAPNKDTYSMSIPPGWSVWTYDQDNLGGDKRCWNSSAPNLQDVSWQNKIASMEVFTSNQCADNSNTLELCNNTGFTACSAINTDAPSLQQAGFGNDVAKSIKVTGDWRAVLFEGENYEGNKALFTSSENDLDHTLVKNSTSSSIQVRKVLPTRVILYEMGDLNGEAFPSDRTVIDLASWNYNDKAKSVRVDPGFEVILCTNANFRGICGRTNTNVNDLNSIANGLRGEVSSVRVCEGSCPPTSMVPVIATPVDTASFLPGSDVTFNWVGNGDEYYIEYWGGDLTSTQNSGGIYGTTSWTKSGLPASANPYYWHVRSWTPMGETGWSSTYSFKVQDIAPKDVVIVGSNTVNVSTNQSYTAYVNPLDSANLNLVWFPAPVSGQGTTTATYNWASLGNKTISLTATNTGGTQTTNYQVNVTCPTGQYAGEYFMHSTTLSGIPDFTRCESNVDFDWGNLAPQETSALDLSVATGQIAYLDGERKALSGTAASGQNVISVADSSGYFTGDEVLVIQMQGTDVGKYEYGLVASTTANTLVLNQNLTNTYTVSGASKAQVLKVPHYRNVTVDGTLTAHAWDGNTGGIVAYRAFGTTTVNGTIDVTGLGYRKGAGNHGPSTGFTGEGTAGPSYQSQGRNGNGGAGGNGRYLLGADYHYASGAGGGGNKNIGGYGNSFNDPVHGSGGNEGGAASGDMTLSTITFGGGGGEGGGNQDDNSSGMDGGNGGGIVMINSTTFTLNGSVVSNGTAGGNAELTNDGLRGGGGGGAGGTILIKATNAAIGTNAIVVNGGAGGANNSQGQSGGGAGSVGRIKVEYCSNQSGSNADANIVQVDCSQDNFSVRWTGNIDFSAAGTYKFTTWTDDGTKVWVDGDLIVDRWVGQDGQTPYSGNKNLTAGTHEVKMEYYEGTGGAKAKLTIEQVSTNNPPTVSQIPGQTITAGQSFSTINLANYGSDPDAGDTLTWSYSGNSNISVAIASNVATLTYPSNWTGTENIAFKATDAQGAFASSTAAFTVNTDPCAGQFTAQYFNNTDLSGTPVLTRCEDFIDNFWWDGRSPDPAVNADNFSARWQGNINFAAGNYTFHTNSDNGIKVWLDGNLVIDHWTSHGWENDEYDATLTAGNHLIKMEYYEVTGDAVAALTWYQYGGNCNNVPSNLYCVAFYNNSTLSGSPVFVSPKKVISYDWGQWGPGHGLTNDDSFSVRWQGNITFTAGTYKFGTASDDGAKLWLDTTQVINDWGPHGYQETYVNVNVSAGTHLVKGEFYEIGGNAYIAQSIASVSNSTPVVNTIPGQTITTGQSFSTVNLSSYGSDPDIGDPITWSYSGNTNISVSIANNVATLTYPANWTGQENITFTATDSHGAAASKSAVFTVNAASSCNWTAQYFNNTSLSGTPVLTRCENDVNYIWYSGSPAPGTVNANNFSARWQGTFNFAAGTYTFVTTSDDGIRVWVDGVQKINNWTAHPAVYNSFSLALSAGTHTIKVEYYESGDWAEATLSWMLPQTQTSNCTPVGKFCAKYFNNTSLTGTPVLSLIEPVIDHDWGTAAPGGGVNANSFSARYEGQFQFAAGTYTLGTGSDNGVRIWVDGLQKINNWSSHNYQENSTTLNLTAGLHTIKVEYYENTGDATIWVDWWQ